MRSLCCNTEIGLAKPVFARPISVLLVLFLIEITNRIHVIYIQLTFLTHIYLFAPPGLVLYIRDSPAPILIVFLVTLLLSGQLKSTNQIKNKLKISKWI